MIRCGWVPRNKKADRRQRVWCPTVTLGSLAVTELSAYSFFSPLPTVPCQLQACRAGPRMLP